MSAGTVGSAVSAADDVKATSLQLDPIRCVAHGLCADLLPERVELDEWGYPIIEPGALPRELVSHARRAARACPTRALVLTRQP